MGDLTYGFTAVSVVEGDIQEDWRSVRRLHRDGRGDIPKRSSLLGKNKGDG